MFLIFNKFQRRRLEHFSRATFCVSKNLSQKLFKQACQLEVKVDIFEILFCRDQ